MTTPGVPLAIPMNPSPNAGQVIPIKAFFREPLPTDTKYPIGFVVIIGRNPSTGTQGDIWYLANFDSSGLAVWKQFSITPGNPGIDTITTNDGAPAVQPDINGNVNVVGDGVFMKTTGQGPASTVTLAPVSPFLISVNVDANTAPGTDPVLPSAAGQIAISGAQVAAGTMTTGLRTVSLAANAFTIQAQRSSAQAVTTIGANGLIHASSVDFTVDANAFLQLNAPIPAFYATMSASIPNVTGDGTLYQLIFNSEFYDTLSNYNAATGVFTAPYNGLYYFSSAVAMQNVGVAMTRGFATINFIGTDDFVIYDVNIGAIANVAGTYTYSGSVIAKLNAGDTCFVTVQIDNSTKTAGTNQNCKFSGCLIRRY